MKSRYAFPVVLLFSLILASTAFANPNSDQHMKSPPKHQKEHDGKRQDPLSDIRQESRSRIQTFQKEQKQKRNDFAATLKNLPPEARQQAMMEHMEEQQRIRAQFHETLHSENLAKLTERLKQNSDLTEEKKQALLAAFNANYEKKVQKHAALYTERRDAIFTIMNDEILTTEQKQERLREYRKQNREQRQNKQEHKQERKQHQRQHGNDDSF